MAGKKKLYRYFMLLAIGMMAIFVSACARKGQDLEREAGGKAGQASGSTEADGAGGLDEAGGAGGAGGLDEAGEAGGAGGLDLSLIHIFRYVPPASLGNASPTNT